MRPMLVQLKSKPITHVTESRVKQNIQSPLFKKLEAYFSNKFHKY